MAILRINHQWLFYVVVGDAAVVGSNVDAAVVAVVVAVVVVAVVVAAVVFGVFWLFLFGCYWQW